MLQYFSDRLDQMYIVPDFKWLLPRILSQSKVHANLIPMSSLCNNQIRYFSGTIEIKPEIELARKNMNTIIAWDINLFLHIFNWNGRTTLDRLMKFITRSGDGYLYPILGVVMLLLDWETGWKVVLAGLLAFAIELPFYKIIKGKTSRLRPFEAIPGIINLIHAPDKYSFPSGHTAAAFIMAIVIGHGIPILIIPLVIWAALVGLSRIYLGVHYPTDVLVGMMIGIGSSLIATQIC